MSISFGSISTGLPKDIVQQLVKAERVPIEKMNVAKGKIEERKGLIEDLFSRVRDTRAKLSENLTEKNMTEFVVDTDDGAIGVNVDKNVAQAGDYRIEVVRMAQKSSAMSSGLPDRNDSYTGVGFLRYYLPDGEVRELYVDSDHANLDGIAGLINSRPEMGVRASVVNDGSGSDQPWRLILSLAETGDDRKVEFPYLYFVDGEHDLYLEFEREGHDGIIKVDGFEIEVPENSVKDIIPGVTIDLKKAKKGEEFSLKVSENEEVITEKFQEIVDSLNSVLQFVAEQSDIDENTDTTRTLGGDILLQTVGSRLRGAIFKEIPTAFGKKRLGDLGVSFNRTGVLDFDSNKFEAMVSKNYELVKQVLTGHFSEEDGVRANGGIRNLMEAAEQLLASPSGPLMSRKKTLNSNIEQINRRIENKEKLVRQKESSLKRKFGRLEETMARIRTQGAGLAALGRPTNNLTPQLG